jgi:hypothetical protein
MEIQTRDKSKLKPIGSGYDNRTRGIIPISIDVHTTNGHVGSTYLGELNYILGSDNIAAHYLIGKEGQITQILHPVYRAWHAGAVNDSRFNNNNSIGIECHYTPGEGAWTTIMHQALTYLVQKLMHDYSIRLIETHRQIATPKGRKIDPSGFGDAEFYLWRSRLLMPSTEPKLLRYKVIAPVVNIRTAPRLDPTNIVGTLVKDDIFESAAVKSDEMGLYVHGINKYAHLTKGITRGKIVDNLGFVHMSNLVLL